MKRLFGAIAAMLVASLALTASTEAATPEESAQLAVVSTTPDASNESLTLAGVNFGTQSGIVTVDRQAASVVSWSDSEVVVRLPVPVTPGSYLVTVTRPRRQGGGSKEKDSDDDAKRTGLFIATVGAVGPQGERGDLGPQGEKGDQGIPGVKGDKGDQGDQGTQGIQGVLGPKGDKGDQGVAGLKGDQGIQGIQGPPGSSGAVASYLQVGNSFPVSYEVSAPSLIVEAPPSSVGRVVRINNAFVIQLCQDKDGCGITLSMINWDAAGQPGQVASRTTRLFISEITEFVSFYGPRTWWRASDDIGEPSGLDGGGTPVQEFSAWDCYFGDAESSTGPNNDRADFLSGFGLLNAAGGNFSDTTTTCRVVIVD